MDNTASRAVIDVGSHSVLLLIAGGSPDAPRVMERQYRITALGAGMHQRGRIHLEAARRTREAIAGYLARCRELKVSRVRLVGTAALREADNREEILEILSTPKEPPIQVLDPGQEAALTRAGALSGLEAEANPGRTVVADLGGRSTEISWAGFSRSLPLGCQRATDEILTGDPPEKAEIDRLAARIESELAGLPAPPGDGRLVCSGGTATTLASLDLALPAYRESRVHGHRLGCRRLGELQERLMGLRLAERQTLPGLEPDRAPVIAAGARILHRLCLWHGTGEVVVSARGLTWGAWLDFVPAGQS